jgi:hypothetical protein
MDKQRGINQELITAFRESCLYKLITDYAGAFLLCIRQDYLCIYHDSDLVAKVDLDKGELRCMVHSYYLSDCYLTGKKPAKKYVRVSPDTIVENIEVIRQNSYARYTPEKKAQQQVFYRNNINPNSEWYCIDIEYKQAKRKDVEFDGRCDIIAISKSEPRRIALIELKYNRKAIGGKSGIVDHIHDFCSFNDSELSKAILREECSSILSNYQDLGIQIPEALKACTQSHSFNSATIEYYVICLYDEATSPKGTVGGYLFDKVRESWGTKRVSSDNLMKKYGIDVESPDCPIKVQFLFKKVNSSKDIDITDILDKNQYDK